MSKYDWDNFIIIFTVITFAFMVGVSIERLGIFL